jgi:predicted  nucleic acid-binding Zn-ribbon protein
MDNIDNKSLQNANSTLELLKQSTDELNGVIKNLSDSQSSLSKALQKSAKDFKENASSIENNQEAIKKLNEEIESSARVLKTTSATLSQNKELMSSLGDKYKTLTETHANNSRAVRDLKLEIVNLSLVINKQEKDLAKSIKTFDFHAKAVEALESSFDKIKENLLLHLSQSVPVLTP